MWPDTTWYKYEAGVSDATRSIAHSAYQTRPSVLPVEAADLVLNTWYMAQGEAIATSIR